MPTKVPAIQSGGRACESYRQPEQHARKRDTRFRARQRHAQDAQGTAEGHHDRKNHR